MAGRPWRALITNPAVTAPAAVATCMVTVPTSQMSLVSDKRFLAVVRSAPCRAGLAACWRATGSASRTAAQLETHRSFP